MLTVSLHGIRLNAPHGLYPQEHVLGNEFEVNITVKHSPQRLPVRHLEDTIDYIAVYELVKKRMAVPTALLETLATEITQEILAKFVLAEEVSISIRKKYPPVSQLRGSVGVSFDKKRKDL